MRGTYPKFAVGSAAIAAAALSLALLAACSTVKSIKGDKGASTEVEARNVAPEDPLARPVQLGWTSARATHCGFIFNADQLRSDFLAAEIRAGIPQEQMKKIAQAYDYTRQSTYDTIKDDPNYCNKEKTTAIRRDLNRYLAGDYTPSARMAQ